MNTSITTTPLIEIVPPGVMIPAQVRTEDELVETWLASFRSTATQRGYRSDIGAFRAFAAKPLRQVTVPDIQAYGTNIAHLAPITVARRLSAVKSLLKWGHQAGYLIFDPGVMVKLPKVEDTLTERIMSEESVIRLLDHVRGGPRNVALLRLIYVAGLRVSEACGLCWRNLAEREASGQISVLGKGGRMRSILLPPALWQRLLALRGDAGPKDAVFRSREGGALDASQVHRILKQAARRAKLPVDVSVHWLRHAHVSHALDRGVPVHVVQATVGHRSLGTTTRYTHVRPSDSSALHLVVG